jgi:ribokinase
MNEHKCKGLVVYGDIGIDIHIKTSYIPKPGQDSIVNAIYFEPGGSAANCAVVAARLGIPTTFIGFVGRDHYGIELRKDLLNFYVNDKYLWEVNGQTGITIAIINTNGERTFYSYRGTNASGEINKIPSTLFNNQQFLHISGYSFQDEISRNNALKFISEARKRGVSISFDPSYWYSREYHKKYPELLSDVTVIFPNRKEAEILTNSNDPLTASLKLMKMGPENVLVKIGSEGCLVLSEEQKLYSPAFPVQQVIDTTGAGDAFCGGFLAGTIYGLSVEDGAKLGNASASRIVGAIGGHTAAFSLSEMLDFLKKNSEEELATKISTKLNIF